MRYFSLRAISIFATMFSQCIWCRCKKKESVGGKGLSLVENKQFLLLPQCFQLFSVLIPSSVEMFFVLPSRLLQNYCMWESVNIFENGQYAKISCNILAVWFWDNVKVVESGPKWTKSSLCFSAVRGIHLLHAAVLFIFSDI